MTAGSGKLWDQEHRENKRIRAFYLQGSTDSTGMSKHKPPLPVPGSRFLPTGTCMHQHASWLVTGRNVRRNGRPGLLRTPSRLPEHLISCDHLAWPIVGPYLSANR